MILIFSSTSGLAQTIGDELYMGVPTCFPISAAVAHEVQVGRIPGVPVFLVEESWCTGGAPAVSGPVVPREIVGSRERLQYVLDGLGGESPSLPYELSSRAGGWVIAPVGSGLLDVLVDIDPEACPTVEEAERCAFGQLARSSAKVAVGPPNPFGQVGTVRENDVRLEDVPILEALRAVWTPHERSPMGFVVQISTERAANGMRFARYTNLFELDLSGPAMEVATPETALSPPRAP